MGEEEAKKVEAEPAAVVEAAPAAAGASEAATAKDVTEEKAVVLPVEKAADESKALAIVESKKDFTCCHGFVF